MQDTIGTTPQPPGVPLAKPPVRFHWSLSQVGDPMRWAQSNDRMGGVPDFAAHVEFCHLAEECGIDSVLVAIGAQRPDPFGWAIALGRESSKVRFLCAIRSGMSAPAYFVQQVNTVSALIDGRIYINVVIGSSSDENQVYGDFLDHDRRYARTDEFWQICRALWSGEGPVTFDGEYYSLRNARLNTPFVSGERTSPEIFLAGSSAQATDLAARHADCLFRLAQPVEAMEPVARSLIGSGTDVGIFVSMLPRPEHAEALRAATDMVAGLDKDARARHIQIRRRSDSVGSTGTYAMAEENSGWVTPYLWAGAVPYLGAPSIALVGGPREIAEAIWAYRQVGVTHFLFVGWPDGETMTFFAREIAPLVRRWEAAEANAHAGHPDAPSRS